MRASYQWLCELVPGLQGSPEEVSEWLTGIGLEVEGVHRVGEGTDQVEVAAVRAIEPHPKSDKLRLVTVDRGAAGQQRVVCGAPNVPDPGGLIVFAPLGVTLPAIGLTILPRAIRGVESEGMICSEAELGLSDESGGILVLEPGSGKPGQKFSEAFPTAQDTVYEIGITPNRPDALGHIGIARDLAALRGLTVQQPGLPEIRRTAEVAIDKLASVDNLDTERCPHYGARAVLDVTVGPSPLWMRLRLHSLGIRAISNVVDLTNWFLLELGQPMHAFDLDLVKDSRIVVRRAAQDERFNTLDGVERTLSSDDLVIADGAGAVALAGVMGGENTEIRPTTRRVLLECAYFDPRGVRRTGRRYGLHTESGFRFERGTDWGVVEFALDRATRLLGELTGGSVVAGAIHEKGAMPALPLAKVRSARLDALLGVGVPFGEAIAVLKSLGFQVTKESGSDAVVEAASWRPDISLEADFIEEVARIRGLDAIPTVLPAIPPRPPSTAGRLERGVLRVAAELGLSEAVTYSFVSRADLKAVHAPEPVIVLKNPMTEDRDVMRTSLLPGLLDAVRRARRRGERELGLFSVGPIFLPRGAETASAEAARARPRAEADATVLPYERPTFTCVLAGSRVTYLDKPSALDVYDAKAVAFQLIKRLFQRDIELVPATDPGDLSVYHPRSAGVVLCEGQVAGRLGKLHPDVVDAMDLGGDVLAVELDLSVLERVGAAERKYRPIPRLPAVSRDVALVVSDEVPSTAVAALLQQEAGPLCESVELFDLFRGEGIQDAHRSLAFHLTYRDPQSALDPEKARTLTDKEVDVLHAKVVQAAKERYGASLRA